MCLVMDMHQVLTLKAEGIRFNLLVKNLKSDRKIEVKSKNGDKAKSK